MAAYKQSMVPMSPSDALMLTVVLIVPFTVFVGLYYWLVIHPVTKKTGQGSLYSRRGMGLRLGGKGFSDWSVRGFAAVVVLWIVVVIFGATNYGYSWLYGAVSWAGLLNGAMIWDQSMLSPPRFLRSLRLTAIAHIPSCLGLLGGWAMCLGWLVFPLPAFVAMQLLSLGILIYVVMLPCRV